MSSGKPIRDRVDEGAEFGPEQASRNHLQDTESERQEVPLCVDLDGTLVWTDILIESIFALLNRNPFCFLLFPFWLCRGKAHFKQQVASRARIAVHSLPYNEELVDFLQEQKRQGRRLVLATASHGNYAQAISEHLGLFDQVLASDAGLNLSGRHKGDRLRSRFGDKKFDYVGNARVDLEVWRHARRALLVSPGRTLTKTVEEHTPVERVFSKRSGGIGSYLKAMRLHQWLKNLLVFVPLVMAHRVHEEGLLAETGLAFLAFGFCASSVYLLNDLLDLPADRQHPTKRHRALAAGDLPLVHGILLIPALMLLAFGIGWQLPSYFLLLLAAYYVVTLAYSLELKRLVLLDVLTLAGLYTIRIIAGGAAVNVEISFWLLAFSMFLFLSLALVKRYSELWVLQQQGDDTIQGRGYQPVDLETLAQLGTSSGYLAVLVLAFYINSAKVTALYSRPHVIWALCPLVLYWVSRVWLLVRRGEIDDDPVLFTLRDGHTQLLAVVGVLILWMAI